MAYKVQRNVPLTTAEADEIEQSRQLRDRIIMERVKQDAADRAAHSVGTADGVFVQPEQINDANHAATVARIREQQRIRDLEDRQGLEAHRKLLAQRNRPATSLTKE